MTKWEYGRFIERFRVTSDGSTTRLTWEDSAGARFNIDDRTLTAALTELGDEGWEVVAATTINYELETLGADVVETTCLLKREVG